MNSLDDYVWGLSGTQFLNIYYSFSCVLYEVYCFTYVLYEVQISVYKSLKWILKFENVRKYILINSVLSIFKVSKASTMFRGVFVIIWKDKAILKC